MARTRVGGDTRAALGAASGTAEQYLLCDAMPRADDGFVHDDPTASVR